jgi:UDP-N-acetylmuramate--alanine ligase
LAQPRRAHLVGALGSGMRSLAKVLAAAKWELSCSDAALPISSAVPDDADLVIASLAIQDADDDLVAARSLGIPVLRYPQMLGLISRERPTLAVAGTHGKSTSTAMLAEILMAAGKASTAIFGAESIEEHNLARCGTSDWFAVEACEYRGSMLELSPHAAAILNIEHDHFDCYPTFATLEQAFADFASNVKAGGLLVVPDGCPVGGRVAQSTSARVETFGLSASADWHADGLSSHRGSYGFQVSFQGSLLGAIQLSSPGRHNVFNALAAAALAHHAGCDWRSITAGLETFAGLKRRLEVIRNDRKLLLIDDYAHHPTEITASLSTIREMAAGRPMVVVFQPHQAVRTARLMGALADSLRNADKLCVADIFRAREPVASPGEVTAADLASRVRSLGIAVAHAHDNVSIEQYLRGELEPGDVLLTMGAGDIGKIAHGFGKRL